MNDSDRMARSLNFTGLTDSVGNSRPGLIFGRAEPRTLASRACVPSPIIASGFLVSGPARSLMIRIFNSRRLDKAIPDVVVCTPRLK